MKKLHIVGLILIAVSIGAIIAFSNDYTSYETFGIANEKEGKTFNVVGTLVQGQEFYYNPQENPDYFEFLMADQDSVVQKVVYLDPMPQDFERSEQVVVTGQSENGVFYAEKILMKCPSKYVEDEVEMIEVSTSNS